MRIRRSDARGLALRGRRADREEGEQGLWLLWLVGGVLSLGGLAFGWWIEGGQGSLRVAGLAVLAFGVVILLLGGYLASRRESLDLDVDQRQGRYSTYLGPGWRAEHFDFAFDDAREVRLRQRVESPGPGRAGGASVAYRKLEARLLVRPRKVIPLDRSRDEKATRALAEEVANVLAIPVASED